MTGKRSRSESPLRPAKRRAVCRNREAAACSPSPSPSPSRQRAHSVRPATPPRARFFSHRRRARSLDRSPSPVRLSSENLRSFESSLGVSSPYMSANAGNRSPTRTDNGSNVDNMRKLNQYNISFDGSHQVPPELQALIDTLEQDREGPVSPNAQGVVDKRRRAALENEATGIKIMEEHVLFRGEAYAGGVPHLTLKDKSNLSNDFLPDAPSSIVVKSWGKLTRPQPDSCIGYITAQEARASVPAVAFPFTWEEEQIADWSRVCSRGDVLFPFLTAQWKSPASGENQFQASCQSARDGATIVNYLHQFFSTAYARKATPVEACHFSVTCEMYSLFIWVHWREIDPYDKQDHYRMEHVHTCLLMDLEGVSKARKILRNLSDWALGERLESIKAALPEFWANQSEKRKKTSTSASTLASAQDESRSQSASTTSNYVFAIPLTPASEGGPSDGADEVAPKKALKRKHPT